MTTKKMCPRKDRKTARRCDGDDQFKAPRSTSRRPRRRLRRSYREPVEGPGPHRVLRDFRELGHIALIHGGHHLWVRLHGARRRAARTRLWGSSRRRLLWRRLLLLLLLLSGVTRR